MFPFLVQAGFANSTLAHLPEKKEGCSGFWDTHH
jgi:hypothetical protein